MEKQFDLYIVSENKGVVTTLRNFWISFIDDIIRHKTGKSHALLLLFTTIVFSITPTIKFIKYLIPLFGYVYNNIGYIIGLDYQILINCMQYNLINIFYANYHYLIIGALSAYIDNFLDIRTKKITVDKFNILKYPKAIFDKQLAKSNKNINKLHEIEISSAIKRDLFKSYQSVRLLLGKYTLINGGSKLIGYVKYIEATSNTIQAVSYSLLMKPGYIIVHTYCKYSARFPRDYMSEKALNNINRMLTLTGLVAVHIYSIINYTKPLRAILGIDNYFFNYLLITTLPQTKPLTLKNTTYIEQMNYYFWSIYQIEWDLMLVTIAGAIEGVVKGYNGNNKESKINSFNIYNIYKFLVADFIDIRNNYTLMYEEENKQLLQYNLENQIANVPQAFKDIHEILARKAGYHSSAPTIRYVNRSIFIYWFTSRSFILGNINLGVKVLTQLITTQIIKLYNYVAVNPNQHKINLTEALCAFEEIIKECLLNKLTNLVITKKIVTDLIELTDAYELSPINSKMSDSGIKEIYQSGNELIILHLYKGQITFKTNNFNGAVSIQRVDNEGNLIDKYDIVEFKAGNIFRVIYAASDLTGCRILKAAQGFNKIYAEMVDLNIKQRLLTHLDLPITLQGSLQGDAAPNSYLNKLEIGEDKCKGKEENYELNY